MYQGPTYREVEELAKSVEEFLERFNMSLPEFEQTVYFDLPRRSPYDEGSARQEQIRLKRGFTVPLFRFIEMYINDTDITAKDFKAMLEDISRKLVQLEKSRTEERLENARELLKVSDTPTVEEIKRAYRRHVKDVHPDLNPDDPEADKRFKEINRAYKLLVEYRDALVIRSAIKNKRDGLESRGFVVASGYPSEIRRLDRIKESLKKAGIPFEVERVQPAKNELGGATLKTVIYVPEEYKEIAKKATRRRLWI